MKNKYPKFIMAADLINALIEEDKIKPEELKHIMKHLTVLIDRHIGDLEV